MKSQKFCRWGIAAGLALTLLAGVPGGVRAVTFSIDATSPSVGTQIEVPDPFGGWPIMHTVSPADILASDGSGSHQLVYSAA